MRQQVEQTRNPLTDVVLTTRPLRVNRSTSARAQPVRSSQRPSAGRQRVGDLLRARMQELGDLQNLAVRDLHFLAHACKAVRPDFQLRHPDRVLVGHAERELARGLRQQAVGAVAVPLLDVAEVARAARR